MCLKYRNLIRRKPHKSENLTEVTLSYFSLVFWNLKIDGSMYWT